MSDDEFARTGANKWKEVIKGEVICLPVVSKPVRNPIAVQSYQVYKVTQKDVHVINR